jgi:hypothetical protein
MESTTGKAATEARDFHLADADFSTGGLISEAVRQAVGTSIGQHPHQKFVLKLRSKTNRKHQLPGLS